MTDQEIIQNASVKLQRIRLFRNTLEDFENYIGIDNDTRTRLVQMERFYLSLVDAFSE